MKQPSKTITIKLNTDEILHLNAALYLGVLLEDWCLAAIACGVGKVDHHSSQWRRVITAVRNKIYSQTKIESHQFGQAKGPNIGELSKILDSKIKHFREEFVSQDQLRWRKNHTDKELEEIENGVRNLRRTLEGISRV